VFAGGFWGGGVGGGGGGGGWGGGGGGAGGWGGGGGGGGGGAGGDNKFITAMEASDMVRKLQCFVMTNKDVLVHALIIGKILQELTEQSLLKQPTQNIL
jgi:hypothetical protein